MRSLRKGMSLVEAINECGMQPQVVEIGETHGMVTSDLVPGYSMIVKW